MYTLVQHGLPFERSLFMVAGHVAGNLYPEDLKAMPPQIIIGAQYVQAAGVALGLKKHGKKMLPLRIPVTVALPGISTKQLTLPGHIMQTVSSSSRTTVLRFHSSGKTIRSFYFGTKSRSSRDSRDSSGRDGRIGSVQCL